VQFRIYLAAFISRLMPASFARAALTGNGTRLDWSPSADISETDKEFVIRAELPAVKQEDVQVTAAADVFQSGGFSLRERTDRCPGLPTRRLYSCGEAYGGSVKMRWSVYPRI
jgi:hypothetical protein